VFFDDLDVNVVLMGDAASKSTGCQQDATHLAEKTIEKALSTKYYKMML